MLYRHVFDKISTEFRGILGVFVNFAGLRGFTWISRLCDRAKHQKPWIEISPHRQFKSWSLVCIISRRHFSVALFVTFWNEKWTCLNYSYYLNRLDESFWQKMSSVIDVKKERVWTALLDGFEKYLAVLTERASLIQETDALRQQVRTVV